jgi:hypothetical protein
MKTSLSQQIFEISLIPILMKTSLSQQIFEIGLIPILRKISPVGAHLFHAGGRTEMTKLIVSFRCFAKAPPNGT